MAFLHIFIFVCLGFAVLVLFLLSANYIAHGCCPSTERKRREDEEVGVRLTDPGNNNDEPETRPTNIYTPLPLAIGASAPNLNDINSIPGGRIRRNTSVQSFDTPISPEEMRAIQSALLRDGEIASVADDTTNCNLLIGVYANAQVFCGYCVNLAKRWVEFYRIYTEHLPGPVPLGENSDNSEFEMRNFFFALMLWNDKIAETKKFHIYTGSRAVNHDNNRLWRRVAKLLEHYSGCDGIAVGNDCRFHVSPNKDAKSFAIKIVPAEDLSRENFGDFQTFISQYYKIPVTNFHGTHNIQIPDELDSANRINDNYQLYLDKVRDARKKWSDPCSKCCYIDDESASNLNIHQMSS